jgi:hypothetical protein
MMEMTRATRAITASRGIEISAGIVSTRDEFIVNSSVLKQRDGVRVGKATIEAFRNEFHGQAVGLSR